MAKKNINVLTRDADYTLPEGLDDAIFCNDYMELVNQYKDLQEELLIIGGLTIFKLFTPVASSLDTTEADELVPFQP